MKNIVYAFTLLLLISTIAHGSKTCMTFQPCGNQHDYHTLRYVQCYCPCKQYKRLPRGQCSYCGHYRYIDDLVIKAGKQIETPKPVHKQAKIPSNVVNQKLYKLFGGKNEHFNPETERYIPILQ